MTAEHQPGRLQHAWRTLASFQAAQGIGLIAGAASVAVASRLLGPSEYGRLTLILAVAQYLVVFSANWTSSAVVRFGREELLRRFSMRQVFWTRLALVAPCIAVALVVMAVAWRPIVNAVGLRLTAVAPIALIAVLLLLADHVDCTLQAGGQWAPAALLTTVEKLGFIAVLAVAVSGGSAKLLQAAIVATVLSQLMRVVAGLVQIWRMRLVGPPTFDRATAAAIIRYSLPLTLTFTIGYVSTLAEPLVIRWYLSIADVGVYQVAYQVMVFAMTALAPLSTMLLPAITSMRVEHREEVVRQMLVRLAPQVVFLSSLGSALVIASTPLWFSPLFGGAYADAIQPAMILLAAAAFQVIVSVYSPLLAAYDLTRASALMNTAGTLVMHLAPLVLLVRLWGTRGAAAAWLVWYVFASLFTVSVMNRRLGIRTLRTVLAPWITIVATAIMFTQHNAAVAALLLLVAIAVAILWSRSQNIFMPADLVLLETAGVPKAVLRVASRAYRILGRSPVAA